MPWMSKRTQRHKTLNSGIVAQLKFPCVLYDFCDRPQPTLIQAASDPITCCRGEQTPRDPGFSLDY